MALVAEADPPAMADVEVRLAGLATPLRVQWRPWTDASTSSPARASSHA
eukprot:SAG11_NODE_34447_length_272_cov_0.578035_1_plen_48_part_10